MAQETNPVAEFARKYINTTNRNIFLTGKAGTGKTTFLRDIVQHTHKNVVVAAPTGIAAINAGGVTLHSLLQLPFGTFIPSETMQFSGSPGIQMNTPKSLLSNLQMNKYKRNMLRAMELLIIDEASMLRADLLDAIDTVLRSVRRNGASFGGVQVLFIGDLLQLPPVIKDVEWRYLQDYYKSQYFFEAHALHNDPLIYLELEKVYRQSDPEFIGILNKLRDNAVTKTEIDFLNQYYRPGFEAEPDQEFINLTTHNRKADSINKNALEKLEGTEFTYRAEIEGEFNSNNYPIEEELKLKKGAQVMFIKNDPSGKQGFFNGKIGKVDHLTRSKIKVSFADGSPTVEVETYPWENKRFTLNQETNEIEEKIIGRFIHFPIKLAWAITIHKSQGLTFERAILDVSGAFAPGQVYVALSRLTSLQGLILSAPFTEQSFGTDMAIKEFAQTKMPPEKLLNDVRQSSGSYIGTYVMNAFNFNNLLHHVQTHMKSYDKNEKQSAKQKHQPWAQALFNKFTETKTVADKFIGQLHKITTSNPIDFPFLIERLTASLSFFDKTFMGYRDAFSVHIGEVGNKKGTKGYQTELRELSSVFYQQHQTLHKAKALVIAVSSEQELTKEKIRALEVNEEYKNAPVKLPPKKVKGEKENTKQVSTDMFNEGKTIEQIADLRGIRELTVENHISWGIQQGKVSVDKFLEKEQLTEILDTAKKLNTSFLSPVKEELNDKYNYSQLRMAMAHKIYEDTLNK